MYTIIRFGCFFLVHVQQKLHVRKDDTKPLGLTLSNSAIPGADPGFPVGGGAWTHFWRAWTSDVGAFW